MNHLDLTHPPSVVQLGPLSETRRSLGHWEKLMARRIALVIQDIGGFSHPLSPHEAATASAIVPVRFGPSPGVVQAVEPVEMVAHLQLGGVLREVLDEDRVVLHLHDLVIEAVFGRKNLFPELGDAVQYQERVQHVTVRDNIGHVAPPDERGAGDRLEHWYIIDPFRAVDVRLEYGVESRGLSAVLPRPRRVYPINKLTQPRRVVAAHTGARPLAHVAGGGESATPYSNTNPSPITAVLKKAVLYRRDTTAEVARD
mmetsp:Transcript_6180/g.14520  ORF Transcript_6180/g.14520 Transcript_6180/m.14520 type:complete len:256 (+) Transcript_6180:3328-4095(+)